MSLEPDSESTMNSQIDFADLKSRFFIKPCSCGNSDTSYFSNIKVDGEVLLRECKKCHDIIGLDDSTYDEVLSWLGDTDNIRVLLCDCGNENPDAFIFEQLGDDIVLRCGECRKTIRVSDGGSIEEQPHGHTKIDPKSTECRKAKREFRGGFTEAVEQPHGHRQSDTMSGEGTKTAQLPRHVSKEAVVRPYGHTKIDHTTAWKLNPGDHVKWNRHGGYEHHAIVVRCSEFDYKYVRMVHYTTTKRKAVKGEIMENWLDLIKQQGDMYRVDYKPGTVPDSDQVIKNAQDRIGEVQYGVFRNNCEHFARWCKTGVCECEPVKAVGSTTITNKCEHCKACARGSEQVNAVASAGKRTGIKTVACAGAKVGARKGVKLALVALGRTAAVKSVAPVVAGAAAVAVIGGIEVFSFVRTLTKARKQLCQEKISQQECIKIVVKKGCRAVGAIAGSTAGAAVGAAAVSIIIPIPIVGTIIGCTLGSLIGEWLGIHAGRIASSLIAAKVKS